MKDKTKVNFKTFWQSSFKTSYFQKNFLHAMAVLSYLPKLKRSLGLVLGAYFLHDFSMKMFLIWYSIYGQKFQCHTFLPSQDIKQNMLLCSYLDNWWKIGPSPSKKNCVICFIENPLKMMKNIFYFILKALFILKQLCWFFNMTKKLLQKLKYLENEKSFWSWRHNLVTKQLQ